MATVDRVQAKFKCDTIINSKSQGWDTTKLVLNVVTAYGSPEDKPFWDATPAGHIELQTVNQRAVEFFEIGQKYNVYFEKVEEKTSA